VRQVGRAVACALFACFYGIQEILNSCGTDCSDCVRATVE
jgi:hypothetical protein